MYRKTHHHSIVKMDHYHSSWWHHGSKDIRTEHTGTLYRLKGKHSNKRAAMVMQVSFSAFSNTGISLDASLKQTTMPLGKHWNLAEETILAKAYLAATQNPFKGGRPDSHCLPEWSDWEVQELLPRGCQRRLLLPPDRHGYPWGATRTQGRCSVFQQGPEHSVSIKPNWCN